MSEDFVSREQHGSTLLLIFKQSVSNLADSRFLNELRAASQVADGEKCQAVVIDFNQIPFFGSSVLEGLCSLWDVAKHADRKMAVCNLSPVGLEIIRISRFDTIWQIFPTRKEALEHFNQ